MSGRDRRSALRVRSEDRRVVVTGSARERVAARRAARHGGRWGLFLLALSVVVVLGFVGLGLALRQADQTLGRIQQTDPRVRATATLVASGSSGVAAPLPNALRSPFNLLLIGVDKRPNPEDGVRSDTLILVHVDPQVGWAGMLSIPRDSMVTIPHVGAAKINTAYAYGFTHAVELYGVGTAPEVAGGAFVAETVEGFLRVSVDYVVQVDFRGFERLVDVLGGVIIDVPTPLFDAEYPTEDYGVERIYIPAGLQVMDGRTALVYARSRHSGSDFDRSQRQQQVLRALFEQVHARGVVEQAALLPRWAEVLGETVQTTLPVRDIGALSSLAALARSIHADRIVQVSINPNDVALDREEGSDLWWRKSDVAALVARWLAGPQAEGETARIQVLNGAAVPGIAAQVTGYLRAHGFMVVDAGDAPQVVAHSLVFDYTGRPVIRRRLVDLLGLASRYVQVPPGADAPPQGYQVDIVVVVGQDYQQRWLEVGP